MPNLSEIVISIILASISLTIIIITHIVVRSRRGSPLTLRIKGFGVEFSLTPGSVTNETGTKDEQNK